MLLKVRLLDPPPFETLVVPIKLIGFANEMGAFVVARVPERDTPPPPLCVKAPEMEVLAPAASVKVPVLETATGPDAAVMRLPSIEKADPVSEMPPMRLVFRLP